MTKIFHILITNAFTNQYTTQKHITVPGALTYEPIWQSSITKRSLPNWQIGKTFRKTCNVIGYEM